MRAYWSSRASLLVELSITTKGTRVTMIRGTSATFGASDGDPFGSEPEIMLRLAWASEHGWEYPHWQEGRIQDEREHRLGPRCHCAVFGSETQFASVAPARISMQRPH